MGVGLFSRVRRTLCSGLDNDRGMADDRVRAAGMGKRAEDEAGMACLKISGSEGIAPMSDWADERGLAVARDWEDCVINGDNVDRLADAIDDAIRARVAELEAEREKQARRDARLAALKEAEAIARAFKLSPRMGPAFARSSDPGALLGGAIADAIAALAQERETEE